MLEKLLRTKLYAPPLRPELVARPQLIRHLNAGLQPGRKLVLVSGPAGSGKTTLLSQFIAQLGSPVAWLELDTADNDPAQFWTYLIAACRSALDEMGDSALGLLDRLQPVPADTIPIMLINDLAQQQQALVLVLDDYHVVRNPVIHEGMSYLLNYLPDNVLLVVSTRSDPPWPLARFRARNQLIELRARDLRFDGREAAQFLTGTMGLPVSPDEIAALETRTEGWIAGLQLAAVAIQSLRSWQEPGQVAAFVHAFTGSHLFVADYLLQEVLEHQAGDRRAFLLQTSVLRRMSAELCDAVTGRQDSAAMLEELQRANLFLIPLDLEGRWFRYHHLFADLLQARLEQEQGGDFVTNLHIRAATWYEEHGFAAEAVSHFLAAKTYERVAALVEHEASALMFSGRVSTLRSWLEALPEATLRAHPRLQIHRLWIDLMQERVALTPQLLAQKETLLRTLPPAPENTQLRVELSAILCRFVAFSGNTAKAIELAEEALQRLPDTEKALRARAYSALAIANWFEGEDERASHNYGRCMRLARETGNDVLAAHATMMLGVSQIDYGRLHQAAATYQSIIELGGQAGQAVFFPAGQGYIGLAGIHLEWHELETCAALLQKGMALCRRGGLAGLSTAYATEARLRQARGDLQGAANALEQLGETGVDPSGTARSISLLLAQDDLEKASRAAAPWLAVLEEGYTGPQPPLLVREIMLVTLARLFLARGAAERASRLLDEVQATAAPDGRNGRLIEVHLLKALARQALNKSDGAPEARQSFVAALELAQPEGYQLLFLEQGPAVQPLLRTAVSAPDLSADLRQYARELLAAATGHAHPAPSAQSGMAAGLVESLTPREMEVLQLVATGDSNGAIAAKLFITVRTVKKHISNILGKLGVSNRTQAVARARLFGVLDSD